MVERVTKLEVLYDDFDTKQSFKNHIMIMAASEFSNLRIMKKVSCSFGVPVSVLK